MILDVIYKELETLLLEELRDNFVPPADMFKLQHVDLYNDQFTNEDIEKKLNFMVFPAYQGGPLMHVIAAKAVAFKEALQPEFKDYQQQIMNNARAMSKVFIDKP